MRTPSRTWKRASQNVASRAIEMAGGDQVARARDLLRRMKPLAAWMASAKPSPSRARVALAVARETMKLAALSAAEEARVAAALELDAATALMETNHVA